jgi:hypothetical protein
MEELLRPLSDVADYSLPFQVKIVLVDRAEDSAMRYNLAWFKQSLSHLLANSHPLVDLEILEASEAAGRWVELLTSMRIIILQEGDSDYMPGEVSVLPSGGVNKHAQAELERGYQASFWRSVVLQNLAGHNPPIFVVNFGWQGDDTESSLISPFQIVRELTWQVIEWSRG